MILPTFPWIHWPVHQTLLACLAQGGEARFVGGAVRNTLLGTEPDDFDLACTHTPEESKRLLSAAGIKTLDTGLQHGTITAILERRPYEITTLRRDIHPTGRHAEVCYTTSWLEDAQRRDFTMNALYVDSEGNLYDYFGGVEDLHQRCVRFIGDPKNRIQEDYLRILRYFRMQAYYGTNWDTASLEATVALREGLRILSGERITKELLKLLDAPNPWDVVQKLHTRDFWPYVLGEKASTPIFSALALVEEKMGYISSALVRLRSLSSGAFPRLVLSRYMSRFLAAIEAPLAFEDWKYSAYDTSVPITEARLVLTTCRLLMKQEPKASTQEDWIRRLKSTLDALEAACPLPPFPVTGADLQPYGLEGPLLGHHLKALRTWWVHQGATASKTDCLAHLASLLAPGVSPP